MLSDVELVEKLLARDPYLQPYEAVLSRRIKKIRKMEALLILGRMSIVCANGRFHMLGCS